MNENEKGIEGEKYKVTGKGCIRMRGCELVAAYLQACVTSAVL
jgi:hypothetical protein